ncbi:MAG: CRISPR-associated helicase Cas3' [Planctomycetota bacterium]|nr:CRISPR-associated helicase Cas3' [Planctomycetota bacterium]
MRTFFAHTAPPGNPWEPIDDHVSLVAERAKEFAQAFDAGSWGELSGLWHDIGKYSDRFQDYLHACCVGNPAARVDHSTAGAQYAHQRFAKAGKNTFASMVLAYTITGHHGGLRNWRDSGSGSAVAERLKKVVEPWCHNAPAVLLGHDAPAIPCLPMAGHHRHQAQRIGLWIRMLFSALCDADFLATEAFMSQSRSAQRPNLPASVPTLREALDRHLDDLAVRCKRTQVNVMRQRILAHCRDTADAEQGFFTLAVPTGGGKTLASLSFALRHACHHNLRRVIVAIPFTSIIEQNAQVYRAIFSEIDPNPVIEHHSNLEPTDAETTTARLQSENWDAPIVVTTNVQLFESLFAAKTSSCRKLHRIVGSVIVLDEVQSLPVELLEATLSALRDLVEVFGCTVVLCSATQPALLQRPDFPIGIPAVTSIIPVTEDLHTALKRTVVEHAGTLTDEALADFIRDEEQALCIVNTTAHAARIGERIGEDPAHFHLSTRMCPAHRLEVLSEIRRRLLARKECRVVSTQLVEAGVDLDFATVYRAPCGFDALTQAAGRCNREGKRDCGRVVSFNTTELPPPGHLRQSAQVASELLPDYTDPLAPTTIEAYFRHYYWQRSSEWDKHHVLGGDVLPAKGDLFRMGIQFADIAERYRIIRDATDTLIVPWGDNGRAIRARLTDSRAPTRFEIRRAQRFSVGIRSHVRERLYAHGAIVESHGFWVLTDDALYHPQRGLWIEKITGRRDPEDNII